MAESVPPRVVDQIRAPAPTGNCITRTLKSLASAKWPASWGALSSRNIPAIATTTRRASMWLSDYRVFLDIGPCPAVGLEDLIERPATAWERAESALDHPDDAAERAIAGHERDHRPRGGPAHDRRA